MGIVKFVGGRRKGLKKRQEKAAPEMEQLWKKWENGDKGRERGGEG